MILHELLSAIVDYSIGRQRKYTKITELIGVIILIVWEIIAYLIGLIL